MVFSLDRGLLSFLVLLALLIASAHCSSRICLGASGDEAQLIISDAEAKVIACYRALVNAEKDGANITELTGFLTGAGWLLSKAKLAYTNGDYENAIKYAGECLLILEGIVNEAEVLRRGAMGTKQQDFMLNYIGSGVGALCIIIGGYAIWLYLNKREKSEGDVIEH